MRSASQGKLDGRHPRWLTQAVIALVLLAGSTARATTIHGPVEDPPDAVPPWDGAGVFVFGGYVLDLTKKAERYIPFNIVWVEDCSDQTYFCLSVRKKEPILGLMHIIVPQECMTFVARQKWSKDGVTTEVLAVKKPKPEPLNPHFNQPERTYYLGSDDNPHVVFEYWPNDGIVAILDAFGDDNLVKMVREMSDPGRFANYPHRQELTTFDALARCRWEKK